MDKAVFEGENRRMGDIQSSSNSTTEKNQKNDFKTSVWAQKQPKNEENERLRGAKLKLQKNFSKRG